PVVDGSDHRGRLRVGARSEIRGGSRCSQRDHASDTQQELLHLSLSGSSSASVGPEAVSSASAKSIHGQPTGFQPRIRLPNATLADEVNVVQANDLARILSMCGAGDFQPGA